VISYPLDIHQGDDYLANVNVTSNGTPFTLTGYTAVAQIRRDVADVDTGTPDATFTCSIVAPCTVRLALGRATTAALSGCYQWDLELHDPSGNVMTIARGPCHVHREVTR
jgi:hypothetical protein